MVNNSATQIKHRGRISFINQRLVSALDNAKVSDTNAVHILIATLESLGLDVNNYIINRTFKILEKRRELLFPKN